MVPFIQSITTHNLYRNLYRNPFAKHVKYHRPKLPSEHAGAVSGLGNTLASLASAIGLVVVGSISGWNRVGLAMILINFGGAIKSRRMMKNKMYQ
jgi:hypothetical protein